MHGHWKQGKVAERVQARGHVLALHGYVALIVDAFGSGERSSGFGIQEYHGSTLGASLLNAGETLLGCQLADNMRGVDLLCSLPFVDASRIAATGASGGGNQTMWLAAMDDRVKAAVPVVSVGTFESYIRSCNCFCEMLPDGLTFTEESAVLAMTAPRALMICTALLDGNEAFQPKEMLRSYENAAPVYRLLDAADHFTYHIYNTPHGYWREMREAMLGWFDFHLKNTGRAMPVPEPAFKVLPEKDLMVFPSPEERPEIGSIASFCRKRGDRLRKESRDVPINAKEKILELGQILHIESPLAVISAEKKKTIDSWDRYTVTLSNRIQLPLCVKGGGESCVIQIHPAGKDSFQAYPDGPAQAALDLSGHGENQPRPDGISPYHDLSRHLMWLGYTIQGEWIRELAAVCDFMKTNLGFKKISLQGSRECAITCLLYSVLNPGMNRLFLIDMPETYRFPEDGDLKSQNLAMPVFNILKWGDLAMAKQLTGAAVFEMASK